jgi:hypothetical protein
MSKSGSAPVPASSVAAAVSAQRRSGASVIWFCHGPTIAVVAFRIAQASAMSVTPVMIT